MVIKKKTTEWSIEEHYSAVQMQKAVSAYFTSDQILPFAFAGQYSGLTLAFSHMVLDLDRLPNKAISLRCMQPCHISIDWAWH